MGQLLTRYCNATCQHDHWRRGHKQICKKIHRGGNAEQYYADKKYREAVAEAVEACAEDAKGQTCYICMEKSRTGECLVRGCACEGDQGFAHISCLVRQDEVLVKEARTQVMEKMKLFINPMSSMTNDDISKEIDELMNFEKSCKLCKKRRDEIILCAVGWGRWKNWASKSEQRLPEEETDIIAALTFLEGCLVRSKPAEAKEITRAANLYRNAQALRQPRAAERARTFAREIP